MEAMSFMEHSIDVNSLLQEVMNREDHAELIDGKIVIVNRTTPTHNLAVRSLAGKIEQHIADRGGRCRVFTENVAVFCDELCAEKGNFFMPDVMAVCNEDGIRDDGVHVAPLFVAEVTSESTRKNDFGWKMYIYGELGVEEYWVLDLQKKRIVQYLAENDFAPEIIAYPSATSLPVHVYPGLSIDLSLIFK